MAQNPEVNFRHYAITTWKAASVGESQNRQSRCKLRAGPKRLPPVFSYHNLSGAYTRSQAHCEARPDLMASFVIREFGGDQGCVRSDQVEPVRVDQQPANAGGGRS